MVVAADAAGSSTHCPLLLLLFYYYCRRMIRTTLCRGVDDDDDDARRHSAPTVPARWALAMGIGIGSDRGEEMADMQWRWRVGDDHDLRHVRAPRSSSGVAPLYWKAVVHGDREA